MLVVNLYKCLFVLRNVFDDAYYLKNLWKNEFHAF